LDYYFWYSNFIKDDCFFKKISLEETYHELFAEITRDLIAVYRITDFEKTSWYVWLLYAISSISVS